MERKDLFLKHVALKGYRLVRNLSIELNPGLNIIIGNNSSGKTSFLNFTYSVLSSTLTNEFADTESDITIYGENILRYTAKSWTKFEPDFTLKIHSENTKYINNEVVDYQSLSGISNISIFKNTFDDIKFDSIFISHGTPLSISAWSYPLNHKITLDPTEIVHPLRHLISLLDSKHGYALRFLRTIIFDIIINSNNIQNISTSIPEKIKIYCDKLSYLLNKYSQINLIRLSDQFNIINTDNEIIINNLFFEFLSNGTWLPFENLSDGSKRMAYILSEFIDYEKTKRNSIFFIEEPELGIHPHQLHKLMNFLKEESETKQIILTTHSPQVLNVLEPDELDRIIICEYDKEKGTQLRHMTEDEKSYAQSYMKEQFLSDFWLYSGFNDDEE